MTSSSAAPVTAQRAWGIGAVAVNVLAILPTLIVVGLMAGVDPNFGWLMFVTIPVLVAGGVIAMLAGIVGLVFAIVRRRGYLWPVIGAAVGIALVAGLSLFLSLGAV